MFGAATKPKKRKRKKNRTSERKISWFFCFFFFCSPLPSPQCSLYIRSLPYIVCGITLIVYDRVLSISNVQLNFARVTFLSFAVFFFFSLTFFPIFSLRFVDGGPQYGKIKCEYAGIYLSDANFVTIRKGNERTMANYHFSRRWNKKHKNKTANPASEIFINVRAVMHAGKASERPRVALRWCKHRCDAELFLNFFLLAVLRYTWSDSNIRRC